MIEHVAYAITGSVVSVVAYLYGYSRGHSDGSYETACGKTNLGKSAFKDSVWWGAFMARKHPKCSIEEVPGVVQRYHDKRNDQLKMMTANEIIALDEFEASKKEVECHGS